MEQYVNMKSPFTGGRVKEIFTTEVQEFRKLYCSCALLRLRRYW